MWCQRSSSCLLIQVGNTHQKLATAEHKAANQHCRVQEATHEQDQAAHCHQAASKQTALLTEQVHSWLNQPCTSK